MTPRRLLDMAAGLPCVMSSPAGVRALAVYPTGPIGSVLVLEAGRNASTDYYLAPRLRVDPAQPWRVVDLDTPPQETDFPTQSRTWVVICRYVNAQWLSALEAARDRLAGVTLFFDDDLLAMMAARDLPLSLRLKVAGLHGRFTERLSRLVSEIWASTPALAATAHATAVLPPVPFDAPAQPRRDPPPVVAYHGSVTHDPERRFLAEVAAQLDRLGSKARLQIAGGIFAHLSFARLSNTKVKSQQAWPDYVARQRAESAALFLAPLAESPVNGARAHVKVYDAARMGAVGLYADRDPYRQRIVDGKDGLLLPMDPGVWAAAIDTLIGDPDTRLRMAEAAYARIVAERSRITPLPLRPAA